MAKHKSSKQSSSYCPIVSDLIDLGAALALDVFSALLRQRESASKHSYRVDPYAAAGIAAGMGRLNTLDEIMQMGGQLGSLGAFDAPTRQTSVLPFHCGLRGNCYAWRLSCEDGSAYGPRTMRPAANMMPPFSRQSSSKPSFILPSWA